MSTPTHASVLVVDDDEVSRTLLANLLQREGHNVTSAANGVQALQLLQAQNFDLMLLDIIMPEMDGFQVLTQVKADPKLAQLLVLMTSAVEDFPSIVRCVKLGAEDYVFKPYHPVLLKARIDSCLEKKRLRDQVAKG